MWMMKTISIFSYTLLLLTISTAYHTESAPYNPPPLMTTRLRFYLHDTLSGATPSAVRIAGPNATARNPIPFGALLSMDDPMTEGPEAASEVVGNARGMYLSASRGDDLTLILYADFAFTAGKFEGSSLTVFSRNPLTEASRELAVVGGRGQFKEAKGTAVVTSYSMDATTGDAILEYNVEVVHAGLGFLECVV